MTVSGGGRRNRQVLLVLTHLLGACLGGACAGFLLGSLGATLGLQRVPLAPVVVVAAFSMLVTLRRRGRSYGIKCQVPRAWGRGLTGYRTLLVWGVLLGSGLATAIPYAGFFVLPAIEAVSGVPTAAALGAVFGFVREIHVVFPLLARRDPVEAMALLAPMKRVGRIVNLVLPPLVVAVSAIGLAVR